MSENVIDYSDEDESQSVSVADSPANIEEVLVFGVGSSLFGVSILSVQELINFEDVVATPIPNAPGFVDGFINLRGSIVSIVHAADRLGVKHYEKDESERVAIVLRETSDSGDSKTVGFIVDEMKDVSKIDLNQISKLDSAPDEGAIANIVKGVLNIGEGEMVTILDVKALIFDGVIEDFKKSVEGIV